MTAEEEREGCGCELLHLIKPRHGSTSESLTRHESKISSWIHPRMYVKFGLSQVFHRTSIARSSPSSPFDPLSFSLGPEYLEVLLGALEMVNNKCRELLVVSTFSSESGLAWWPWSLDRSAHGQVVLRKSLFLVTLTYH